MPGRRDPDLYAAHAYVCRGEMLRMHPLGSFPCYMRTYMLVQTRGEPAISHVEGRCSPILTLVGMGSRRGCGNGAHAPTNLLERYKYMIHLKSLMPSVHTTSYKYKPRGQANLKAPSHRAINDPRRIRVIECSRYGYYVPYHTMGYVTAAPAGCK